MYIRDDITSDMCAGDTHITVTHGAVICASPARDFSLDILTIEFATANLNIVTNMQPASFDNNRAFFRSGQIANLTAVFRRYPYHCAMCYSDMCIPRTHITSDVVVDMHMQPASFDNNWAFFDQEDSQSNGCV